MSQRYRTIVLDPPWPYEEGFAATVRTGRDRRLGGATVTKSRLPYASMTLAQIAELPLADLADSSARLFCWTTCRYLPQTFPLLDGWGFSYKQTLVWHKPDVFFGGSVAPNAEFLLVATRGQIRRLARAASSVIKHAQRQLAHSQKPDVFLDLVEQVSPGPYLEMFARRARFGWDYWGDESLGTAEIVPTERPETPTNPGEPRTTGIVPR